MAALNFPANPANQNPANTFSPSSSPDATTNGATYIWNGTAWTGYVEGAAQYWARAGSVLTPLNTGDTVTVGGSDNISLFPTGSATFASGVECVEFLNLKHVSSSAQVIGTGRGASSSNDIYFRGTDQSGVITWGIESNDGSATFAGDGNFKGSNLSLSHLGTANNGVFLSAGDLGAGNRPKIEIKGASDSALQAKAFTIGYNNGANIVCQCDYEGNATFAGSITVDGDSTTEYSYVSNDGKFTSVINNATAGTADLIAVYNQDTAQSTFTVRADGSATFAGKVTNSSGGYGFPDGTTQTTAAVTSAAPGNGALTIKTAGQGSNASGTFTANQSSASTLTLPVIRYQDVSGTPSIPAAANNGTITIVQPGTTNQTFTVNQSGNTTITLKNDNTQVTPGNGALTIKTAGQGSNASGTFTANQSGASTLTLPVIRYTDLSGRPTIPAAANNGQINISVGTGLSASGSNATANQSGNTTRTISLDTTYTDGRYVKKTGDTMTGLLTLSGNPSSNLQAATKQYVDNRGGAGTVGAIAWMNTSRNGTGTGYGVTVSRVGNAEYQYTFVTAQSNTNYAVLGQTQEEQFETTRVKNKTTTGFRITTAWVKTENGVSSMQFADNAHAVAVFSSLSPG